MLLTSCDGFLTVNEKGKSTIPSFLSDPSGLRAGLLGAYTKYYASYDNEFLKYPEVAGNMVSLNLSSGSSMQDQYNFVPNPISATTSYYIWYRLGEALANTNNIIKYAPDVASDYPTQKAAIDNILGQAYVLRALCHFDLCRVYAQPYNYTADASHLGVPVINAPLGPNDVLPRSSVKKRFTPLYLTIWPRLRLCLPTAMPAMYTMYRFRLSTPSIHAYICIWKTGTRL